jgi:hypothetical protein
MIRTCPRLCMLSVGDYTARLLEISYLVSGFMILNILITYVPASWNRFLLEKLTGLQLVNKFPAFYVTRRLITGFTSACHLSLSWAS